MGDNHRPLVLLTGASGYIGGRLLKELEKAGWPLRCLARRPDFLRPKVAASTEVVKADCLDRGSLGPAMTGVHTAYYLVHSMGSLGKFEQANHRRQAKQLPQRHTEPIVDRTHGRLARRGNWSILTRFPFWHLVRLCTLQRCIMFAENPRWEELYLQTLLEGNGHNMPHDARSRTRQRPSRGKIPDRECAESSFGA
jgi:hypothetical protein